MWLEIFTTVIRNFSWWYTGFLVLDIKQVVRNLDNLKNNNKPEHKSLAQLY
jgi:hypothetical protein